MATASAPPGPPPFRLLNHISTQNIKGDLFGGVTAAVIALPMALAFGVASGAGAAAGLWGAVLVGLFAALFGGTPTLISEPTGAMIFGVAKAIGREHNAIGVCKAVMFDLTEVSHLGVTAALAVELAVEEAIEKGRQVFVVGASGTTRQRLEKLGLYAKLPLERTTLSRHDALQQAVAGLA